MSLRRDNLREKDKFYMQLALNLASERVGLTGNNPSVGCVIVKNNEIISIGQTSKNGRPHAEFNAIKSADKKKIKEFHYVRILRTMYAFWKNTPMY